MINRKEKPWNCKWIVQTGDSFGKYVSTYCYFKHIHLHFSGKDPDIKCCENCPHYEVKKNKKGR